MTPWRTGRKVGRTIYFQLGPDPSDDESAHRRDGHPGLGCGGRGRAEPGARDRRGRVMRYVVDAAIIAALIVVLAVILVTLGGA